MLIGSDVNNYSSDVSNNNHNSPLAGSRQSSERTFVNKAGRITSWPGAGVVAVAVVAVAALAAATATPGDAVAETI